MNDEELGRRLPALLTDEPLAPSTVDIAHAMRQGRRRRSIHHVASGLAVLAAITAIPIALQSQRSQAPPVTPPSASVSASPSASARSCWVAAQAVDFREFTTDPSGQHFAGTFINRAAKPKSPADGPPHEPAIWKDGKSERIPIPQGLEGEVRAINSAGVVIGTVFTGKTGQWTFAYTAGEVVALPGVNTAPHAINEAGVIVGARWVTASQRVPVRWRSATSPLEELPLPEGATDGTASVVMADGSAIGQVLFGKPGQPPAAYVWAPDGTASRLPHPDGFVVDPYGSNGDWVYGSTRTNTPELAMAGFLFNVRTGEFRSFPDFAIRGVTADGWFVGKPRSSGVDVLSDGNTLVPLPAPAGALTAVGGRVSVDGKVVTGQTLVGDKTGAVIWRCS